MDPEYINSASWREIGNFLTFIWLILLFNVGFGFNFLMAHAIIPSLVTTGHLPQRLNRVRRIFYGGAFAALALSAFAVSRVAVEARLLEDIWGRFWM